MASPQKENGYTAIANEIMESISKVRLLGSEFQIIFWIIRQTYGFHKKEDVISLTQFEKHTGLSRPTVVKSLKNLLANNIITKKDNKIKFNKDWEMWGSKAGLTSKAVLTRPSKHRLTDTSKAGLTHKRYIKDTITKERGTGEDLIERLIKKEMEYTYESLENNPKKRRAFKTKISQDQNKLFMAVGALWVNMTCEETGLEANEVPIKGLAIVLRKLWERENRSWKYEDFKELFKYFFQSKLAKEDKVSFDLCLSEKYVAKYKIARKNRKATFAGVSNELAL